MSSPTSTELPGGGATSVGRYFTVVSLLPATVFASYIHVLLASGAWNGPVQFSKFASDNLAKVLGDVSLVGISAILLALTLNPIQFGLLQFFEGYWGTGRIGREFQFIRQRHHRRRSFALGQQQLAATMSLNSQGRRNRLEGVRALDSELALSIMEKESYRLQAGYPIGLSNVLPTRFGNALRRYELLIGKVYGMSLIPVAPRLGMVGRTAEVSYVQDQRTQLELAIRTSFLALIAAGITVIIMFRHGFWLLLALIPYCVGYVSYRGAVALAHSYGNSLSVLLELNRFALYDRLHLPLPDDIEEEVDLNERLMPALRFEQKVMLDYVHPQAEELLSSAVREDKTGAT